MLRACYFGLIFCFSIPNWGYAGTAQTPANHTGLDALFQKYSKSTNATDGQAMKESLQRSLDTHASELLSIEGLNVADICDGGDIDLDSGLDTKKMMRHANQRILKVKNAMVRPEVKRSCIAALEKFKSCVTSRAC